MICCILVLSATLEFRSYQITAKIGIPPQERPSCKVSLPVPKLVSLVQPKSPPTSSNLSEVDSGITTSSGFATSATAATTSGLNKPATITQQPPILDSPNPPIKSRALNNQDPNHHQQQAATTTKQDTSERLRQLRLLLSSNNYDAYLVGPNDEHGSEYVSDYDRRLRFISGFGGSNGFALITNERAILFTDGRYAIQAELEVDCNWTIVVSDDPIADICRWVEQESARQEPLKIATDARLLTLPNYDILQAYVETQIGGVASLVLISQDLVDVVWNNEAANSGGTDGNGGGRHQPQEPIFVHQSRFTGNVTWQEKVARLADKMAQLNARHYVIGKLDNIAWLLNLRGSDIPKSPLFKSYLLISRQTLSPSPSMAATSATNMVNSAVVTNKPGSRQQDMLLQSPQILQVPATETIRITLFVDPNKVGPSVREHLHLGNETLYVHHNPQASSPRQQIIESTNSWERQHSTSITNLRFQVEMKDYEIFIVDMRNRLSPDPNGRLLTGKLLLDTRSNVAIHVLAKSYDDRMILQEGLIDHMKAVKTDSEVEGMRQAHWRDSLAISMLLAKLDEDIGDKKQLKIWSEVGASKELSYFRTLMDYNYGESFETISAYGSRAAIVHYSPKETDRIMIGNESTYLLDTGGQYLDGTTDITRTMHFGKPTDTQRETYTRVLMGAIDCMSLVFFQPTKSPFRISDLLVRRHLMEIGLDYAHGTGHGIGLFSLVHEAPNLIEHYQFVSRRHRQAASEDPQKQQQQQQPAVHQEPIMLQPNMFTSVEPGYYKENDFGIRLENIVVTQKLTLQKISQGIASYPNSSDHVGKRGSRAKGSGPKTDRQLLRFEPISLVPFEPKLIKFELLSNKQKIWLNSYNLLVRFRMTQQINYYLSKLNIKQQSSGKIGRQVASRGLNNSTSFMARSGASQMDPNQFREDLERAHRWIVAKTELIQLDHPVTRISRKKAQVSGVGLANQTDQNIDTKRLMLAYMSSLPFNDQAASEAIAALAAESNLIGRSDNNSMTGNQTIHGVESHCIGSQCDLGLINKLNLQHQSLPNGHSYMGAPNSRFHADSGSSESSDDLLPLPGDEMDNNDNKSGKKNPSDGFMSQWFGINNKNSHDDQWANEDSGLNGNNGPRSLGSTISRWTLLVLGSLLVMQAALTSMAFTLHWRSRNLERSRSPITISPMTQMPGIVVR